MLNFVISQTFSLGLIFIESFRANHRVVLFGLFAWTAVGLSSLHPCVCSFVRRRFLRAFWELGAPFGESWGPLGFQFGGSGGVGTILGSLCISSVHFGGSGERLGSILGSLERLGRLSVALLQPLAATELSKPRKGKLCHPSDPSFWCSRLHGMLLFNFGQTAKKLKMLPPHTLKLCIFGG
jgi:hypothetical protein